MNLFEHNLKSFPNRPTEKPTAINQWNKIRWPKSINSLPCLSQINLETRMFSDVFMHQWMLTGSWKWLSEFLLSLLIVIKVNFCFLIPRQMIPNDAMGRHSSDDNGLIWLHGIRWDFKRTIKDQFQHSFLTVRGISHLVVSNVKLNWKEKQNLIWRKKGSVGRN